MALGDTRIQLVSSEQEGNKSYAIQRIYVCGIVVIFISIQIQLITICFKENLPIRWLSGEI